MYHPFFAHGGPALGWPWWVAIIANGLFWALLLVAVLVLIISLVRRPTQQTTSTAVPAISALEILSQRYARGEIDAATYEEMRQRILGSNTPPPMGVSV